MKHKIFFLIILMTLNSCKKISQDKNELSQETPVIQKDQKKDSKSEEYNNNNEQQQIKCEEYWARRFPGDSLKARYINEVISINKLTKNNLIFLNALIKQKEGELAFRKVLSPIFRLSKTEIGIFSFLHYIHINDKITPVSKELDIINKFSDQTKNTDENYGKIKYHLSLLDTILYGKAKPQIYYYTTKRIGSTQVMELASYEDECLEYFEYLIDTTSISLEDKVLFSSPYVIDLVFENNPEVDLLLQKDYREDCVDCPNSTKFQRSFARISGTNNLYFVFADTFPLNNKLDTPSRALILINHKNEAIYLWYDEIDLFGCSCL